MNNIKHKKLMIFKEKYIKQVMLGTMCCKNHKFKKKNIKHKKHKKHKTSSTQKKLKLNLKNSLKKLKLKIEN